MGPVGRDVAGDGRAASICALRAVTWFNLGDSDLATHLFRTDRLRAGARLSEVTAEIAAAWSCRCASCR